MSEKILFVNGFEVFLKTQDKTIYVYDDILAALQELSKIRIENKRLKSQLKK